MGCKGWIKKVRFLLVFAALLLIIAPAPSIAKGPLPEMDPSGYPAPDTGCLAAGKCHAGIEPIRAHNSEMARQIYAMGNKLGDPNGCVVCHGGDPTEEKDAAKAHSAAPTGGALDTFVLHSASVWVNEKICVNVTRNGYMPSIVRSCRPKQEKSRVPSGAGDRPVPATPKNTAITMSTTRMVPHLYSVTKNIRTTPRP